MMTRAHLMTLLAVLGLQAPADAATYIVNYDWNSANRFQALLEGTLNASTNRVTISSVTSLQRNGVLIAGSLSVASTDAIYGQGRGKPSFNPNGSYVDFGIYQDTGDDVEQLLFAVGDNAARLFGTSVALTSGWGGNDDFRAYNRASFVVTAVAAVPEPMSWTMMIVGFGMLGVALRGRQWIPAMRPHMVVVVAPEPQH